MITKSSIPQKNKFVKMKEDKKRAVRKVYQTDRTAQQKARYKGNFRTLVTYLTIITQKGGIVKPYMR